MEVCYGSANLSGIFHHRSTHPRLVAGAQLKSLFQSDVVIRLNSLASVVLLLVIAIVPCFATGTWFNQRVTWKYGKEGLAWRTALRGPHGKGDYQLALSPLWAVEGGVIAVEIIVARPEQPTVNLLGRRLNGVKYPFVITVEELHKGVAKSKFSAVRTFQVDNLVLHVTIENSRLGRGVGSGSTFCQDCKNIQELSMRILVESKTP